MPREYKAYLKDILEAIRKIEKYTDNLPYDDFIEDELIPDIRYGYALPFRTLRPTVATSYMLGYMKLQVR